MRVLILGANGYLGRRISRYLEENGHIVARVIRNPSCPNMDRQENVIKAEPEVIQKEINHHRYDWLINCAAVYEGKNTPVHEIVEANLIFATRVLNLAVESGIENFLTIDTSLPRDLNLYSFTKKSLADLGRFYAQKYRINFVNVVLEMFYGEDEPENRFLVRCCRAMTRGETLLLTEGTQKRDIIYIEDVCEAISILLNASLKGYADVPLGSGKAVSLRTILEYMHKVLASESKLDFGAVPMRENEPDCLADISLLKSYGYTIRYPWMRGIAHLCECIKENDGIDSKRNK